MRTRGLKHGCEQFDARRGPGGEPERRECAILLALSRLCRQKFRLSCVQNSGPLGTQTLILGILKMPTVHLSHGILIWGHSYRIQNRFYYQPL